MSPRQKSDQNVSLASHFGWFIARTLMLWLVEHKITTSFNPTEQRGSNFREKA
jgi:hypothetical protein